MKDHVVVFVEGDTDEVVFKRIVDHFKNIYPACSSVKCHVINLRGVGRYSSKASAKLRGEIIPKILKEKGNLKSVICSHDTDVFDFSPNPPVNLNQVVKELKLIASGAMVDKLEVRSSMEDWLLADMEGLCRYLKINKAPAKLNGRSGYEKIRSLFKRKDKLYTKGYDCENIINHINIEAVIDKYNDQLYTLKKALGI